MSVIIKGLDVPGCCQDCPFCDYEEGNCLASRYRHTDDFRRMKRMDWCPMIGLPEKHGRLIDAGRFEVLSYASVEGTPNDTFDDGVMFVVDRIDNAPTIVEEEGYGTGD